MYKKPGGGTDGDDVHGLRRARRVVEGRKGTKYRLRQRMSRASPSSKVPGCWPMQGCSGMRLGQAGRGYGRKVCVWLGGVPSCAGRVSVWV